MRTSAYGRTAVESCAKTSGPVYSQCARCASSPSSAPSSPSSERGSTGGRRPVRSAARHVLSPAKRFGAFSWRRRAAAGPSPVATSPTSSTMMLACVGVSR
eukprot:2527951-Prymnesium_polylepis.1